MDLWIYDMASRKAQRLSQSAIASLGSAPIPESQIVHYKSFDGKIISALLWVPFNLRRDGSNPALVLPHGGPTGQVQDSWNPRVAALVSRGYICIAPNRARLDRLWDGFSAGKLSGSGRGRLAGRGLCGPIS